MSWFICCIVESTLGQPLCVNTKNTPICYYYTIFSFESVIATCCICISLPHRRAWGLSHVLGMNA